MITGNDILQILEQFAPPGFAESWDNVGLLCGSGEGPVSRVLVALDITRGVAREACRKGAQMVVSHHPVIFKPLSVLAEDSPLWHLAAGSVSAVCMHTNLDVCEGGVNDALARRLGFDTTGLLLPTGSRPYRKITVFVPAGYEETVRGAMARAGAGRLGAYDSCAFAGEGIGYFRPLAGANPFIGSEGILEKAQEVRLEAVCRAGDLAGVLAAMRKAHPYEVPAYDVLAEEALTEPYGLGRVGELAQPLPLREFAAMVREKLASPCVCVYGKEKPVKRVALCGGAGDEELVRAARKAGADVFVVGELKHSLLLEALENGLSVVTAGHFATENVVCPVLRDLLAEKFPDVSFELAESNTDPALGAI